jgi:diacylglycerol kinase (ATP)
VTGVVREIALLTNPAAGRGRAARVAGPVTARREQAGFRVRRLQGRDVDEAQLLAARAVEEGVESLVVVGGDGLVHLAVQVLAHRRTSLGIIPAGTGNDAARCLGVPLRDVRAAADLVIAGHTRSVDLGRVGGSSFLCVLSAGFDAAVTERAATMRRPRGRARYVLATLAELRRLRPATYGLRLDDGTTREVEGVLVAVANAPSFGGGLQIAPDARLDDGLLDLVLVGPLGRVELARTFPRLYRGTQVGHPAYEHHRVREVVLTGPSLTAYADGERLGPLPLSVRAAPAALRVVVPPRLPAGCTPAS